MILYIFLYKSSFSTDCKICSQVAPVASPKLVLDGVLAPCGVSGSIGDIESVIASYEPLIIYYRLNMNVPIGLSFGIGKRAIKSNLTNLT